MVRRILSERKAVTDREKRIEFDLRGHEGAGATFAADDSWNVVFDPRYEEAQRNTYEYCASHPNEYDGPFRRVIEHTRVEDAVAECECGKRIELWDQYLGASECPCCGRWHNLFGQTLVDPKYWED